MSDLHQHTFQNFSPQSIFHLRRYRQTERLRRDRRTHDGSFPGSNGLALAELLNQMIGRDRIDGIADSFVDQIQKLLAGALLHPKNADASAAASPAFDDVAVIRGKAGRKHIVDL